MWLTPNILDAQWRRAQMPPPGRPAPEMPAIAPCDTAVPPTQAEPPFVRGCRRALRVVEEILAALCFLVVVVFLVVAFFWLVGFVMDLLTGRRNDR
jgi:hypothetical protein